MSLGQLRLPTRRKVGIAGPNLQLSTCGLSSSLSPWQALLAQLFSADCINFSGALDKQETRVSFRHIRYLERGGEARGAPTGKHVANNRRATVQKWIIPDSRFADTPNDAESLTDGRRVWSPFELGALLSSLRLVVSEWSDIQSALRLTRRPLYCRSVASNAGPLSHLTTLFRWPS